jgi:hypothetical protein
LTDWPPEVRALLEVNVCRTPVNGEFGDSERVRKEKRMQLGKFAKRECSKPTVGSHRTGCACVAFCTSTGPSEDTSCNLSTLVQYLPLTRHFSAASVRLGVVSCQSLQSKHLAPRFNLRFIHTHAHYKRQLSVTKSIGKHIMKSTLLSKQIRLNLQYN